MNEAQARYIITKVDECERAQQAMPLVLAMLCVSCDHVFQMNQSSRCPRCQSAAVAPLTRWVASMPETRAGIAG